MSLTLFNQRKYHAFISYSHADKAIVDPIYNLMSSVANIPVWYDATDMQVSSSFASELPLKIAQCRSLIIILSKNSVNSNWVKSECEYAVNHQNTYPDFRILPICIDGCKTPTLLEKFTRIDLPEGKLDLVSAHKILSSLYLNDAIVDHNLIKDIYVSRSWRTDEAKPANLICRQLDNTGLRLVGDSTDQSSYGDGSRVRSIISSCWGLVAIVPHRKDQPVSKYILAEIRHALNLNRPCLVIAEPGVQLPEDVTRAARCVSYADLPTGAGEGCPYWIEDLIESLAKPEEPHYIFYSTSFKENKERNKFIKLFIERITGMQCMIGDDVRQQAVQEVITRAISKSYVAIADISKDNINTMIEAGIARGANRNFILISKDPRRRPVFMFADQQVWYYEDDVQLLGTIFRLTYPYRRRIINYELPKIWE